MNRLILILAVLVKDTKIGTTTDFAGSYTLENVSINTISAEVFIYIIGDLNIILMISPNEEVWACFLY